jgi:hypothetical protein
LGNEGFLYRDVYATKKQIVDTTVNFTGTWAMDKVYSENFGDTTGSNAASAILLFDRVLSDITLFGRASTEMQCNAPAGFCIMPAGADFICASVSHSVNAA